MKILPAVAFCVAVSHSCVAPSGKTEAEVNDVNTPLHLMQPHYETGYGIPAEAEVKQTMDRVLTYLEGQMPAELDGGKLKQGGFRLTSYEIGVLYSAAQQAAQVTGDSRYASFAADRLMLIAHQAPIEEPHLKEDIHYDDQMRKVLFPTALDDAGAMCASFIRLEQTAPDASLRPVIDRYVDYVMNKQYRLKDGTLARIRPHYNTVWLDDMYMGVPCLAWYGRLTGDARYYDEALRQMRLFRDKMWVDQASLFRHGWVEEMEPHPFGDGHMHLLSCPRHMRGLGRPVGLWRTDAPCMACRPEQSQRPRAGRRDVRRLRDGLRRRFLRSSPRPRDGRTWLRPCPLGRL